MELTDPDPAGFESTKYGIEKIPPVKGNKTDYSYDYIISKYYRSLYNETVKSIEKVDFFGIFPFNAIKSTLVVSFIINIFSSLHFNNDLVGIERMNIVSKNAMIHMFLNSWSKNYLIDNFESPILPDFNGYNIIGNKELFSFVTSFSLSLIFRSNDVHIAAANGFNSMLYSTEMFEDAGLDSYKCLVAESIDGYLKSDKKLLTDTLNGLITGIGLATIFEDVMAIFEGVMAIISNSEPEIISDPESLSYQEQTYDSDRYVQKFAYSFVAIGVVRSVFPTVKSLFIGDDQ